MHEIPQIDVAEAMKLLEEGEALFVDVRDAATHAAAHIPGSVRLDDRNLEAFLAETERSRKVVVYCYHGNASMGGTRYLMEQGFQAVFSLRGGFEAWRSART